ncbi:MAG: eCIS core domain-containing protein [Bacteroidia bacterium]
MKDYDYSRDDRTAAIKRRRDIVNRMNSDKKRVARKKVEEEENKKNTIQAKLEIGASDDVHEQHADAVAKKVINNEDASHLVQNQPSATITSQTKEEEGTLMAKSEDGSLSGTEKLQTTLDSSKGSGQALDDKTKTEMGDKMGADLSDVKIHTDSRAHEMSENINAKAFTHGQDIYFKQGNFDTTSTEGKSLLAHELAHTQQQKNGVGRKVQRQPGDGDDKKVSYNIKIPPGTISREGFLKYAELIIFKKVVNIAWVDSAEAAAVYSDISNHIGVTVTFSVSTSMLAQNQVDKKDTKVTDKGYNELKGDDKKDIVDEINKRYYESTGVKPGTAIQPGDTDNAAVWNNFKQEVMAEKQMIDSLPPEMKKFIHIEKGVKPEDFEKYVPVVKLLQQLSTADFLDYQGKVNAETTDLAAMQQSLNDYINEKQDRQKAAESRETIKTKLYGLGDIYKQYLNYKSVADANKNIQRTKGETQEKYDERKASILSNQNKLQQELTYSLKANGFDSIDQFETYISDYEKAFEAETIKIAEDHLLRYQHFLYEEGKKLDDDAYITNLFQALSSSGAKEHYENANANDDAANSIIPDDAGYAANDQKLKSDVHADASKERYMGDAAINAIPSALIQDTNFNKEDFAGIASKEELKRYLKSFIHSKQESLDETWEDIHAHPDHIYELDKLFALSIQQQQIEPGSIFDQIIQNKAAEINQYKILKAICFIVIALVLTVASFGAAGPVAIAAGIASAGISLYGVYEAAEEYKKNNAANDVGLLTDDPSLIWVMLAIVGAAADIAALSSAFKAAGALSKFTKEFNVSKDVDLLEKNLATIEGLESKIKANILKQAKIQAQEEKMLAGFAELRKMTFVTIPGLAQTGELLARAVFAVRKGILSIDSFIAELKAAKLIGDTGLNADELLLVKDAFAKAKTLAKDDHLVLEIDKAVADGDLKKLNELLNAVGNFENRATYIKNGCKLDEITLDEAYKHIDDIELNGAGGVKYGSSGDIVGCHNINNFKVQTIANGGRIEIINETPVVDGVIEIEYKVLKNDGSGEFIGNGRVFKKTTFDPAVFPENTMKDLGYNSFKYAIDNNTFDLPPIGARGFYGIANGRTIQGYYQIVNGEKVIKTWWISN